ncbi:uncharacterized protein EV420DRAFT_841607 [Desarmillaria tabescens]|uniref:Secreted protein n=1 Tax=Armillaria tabescens TaxID=1929756 RepID=A0AA39JT93_ARMTA|nr:uncharacterized protein EV420DRAFT_841607 [Desarmillaria tabescens]KAK0448403.1 hypothetical protein EV420DRAFT_841607 [Desarmillaria tabescens]
MQLGGRVWTVLANWTVLLRIMPRISSQFVRLTHRACARLGFAEFAFESITLSILIPRTIIGRNSPRFRHQLTTTRDCTIQRYWRPCGVLLWIPQQGGMSSWWDKRRSRVLPSR